VSRDDPQRSGGDTVCVGHTSPWKLGEAARSASVAGPAAGGSPSPGTVGGPGPAMVGRLRGPSPRLRGARTGQERPLRGRATQFTGKCRSEHNPQRY
jgi:hypothetical protein